MSIPPTKFPKEAREPLEELLDGVQDAVLGFDEDVLEKKVPCFEAAITLMSGNVFTF